MQEVVCLKLDIKAMLQMLEVLNKNLQALCSQFFGVLVNYGLQLGHIPLGKNIMLIFQSFKVVVCSFTQLIKWNTKGVTFKVGVIVVKGQAVQHSKIGLAELLFRNISLLTKIYKNSQFEVKVIIFTIVLRFVGVKLSQVGQLLIIGFCLSGLQIYGLQIYDLWICGLNNRGNLVCILVYRGIAVHNLGTKYTLACKINSKGTWVYEIDLVEQVRYKASNPIEFGRSKEFVGSFDLV